MKLIIQNIDGQCYAYMESKKHFKIVEPTRPGKRSPTCLLDDECDLEKYTDTYFVFDVKEAKK